MILHGVNLNFGVDSTIIGVNGLFQSRDHHFIQKKRDLVNMHAATIAIAYSDQYEEANFTYIAYQPIRPLIVNPRVDIPTLGGVIQIIDPRYIRIAGKWFVDDIDVSNSNTTSVRVSLKISRYPFVAANNPLALFPPKLGL